MIGYETAQAPLLRAAIGNWMGSERGGERQQSLGTFEKEKRPGFGAPLCTNEIVERDAGEHREWDREITVAVPPALQINFES